MIIPYGYYSLREVFDIFGEAALKESWSGDEASFKFERRDKAAKFSDSENSSIITPLSDIYFCNNTKGFLNCLHTEDSINSLVNLFGENYYQKKKAERQKAVKEKERRVAESEGTRRRIYPTHIPDELGENGELDPQRELKINLIKKGIKYWIVAQDLMRILANNDLESKVVDRDSGIMCDIKKNYWLASKSEYSFSSGGGAYDHYYTTTRRWEGNDFTDTKSIKYNGTIIIHQKACDELVERLFKDYRKSKSQSKAGRKPKINWEEFGIEVFRRLISDDHLESIKQDWFAEQMQEWGKEKFGEKVGLSTIKAKLKPYWDIIKPDKSN